MVYAAAVAQVWDHVAGQWRTVRDLFLGDSPSGAVHQVTEQVVTVDGLFPPYTVPGDPRPGFDVSGVDSAGRDRITTLRYYVNDLGVIIGGWDHPQGPQLRPLGSTAPTTSLLQVAGLVGLHPAVGVSNAAYNITDQVFLAVDVALDDWTPATVMALISKYVVLFNLKGYMLQLQTNGLLQGVFSPDGSTDRTFASTVAPAVSNGQRLAVGVELDPSAGVNRTATFYTAPSLLPFSTPPSWTQLGAVVSQAGAESISVSSVGPSIGSTTILSPVNVMRGKIFAGEIRSGNRTGTVVDRVDFTHSEPGTRNLVGSSGLPWVVNGTDARLVAA